MLDVKTQEAQLRADGILEVLLDVHYSLSIEEVELAFKMAASGKLPDANIKGYFNMFTAVAFGEMLASYKQVKRQTLHRIQQEEEQRARKMQQQQHRRDSSEHIEKRKQRARIWYKAQSVYVDKHGVLDPDNMDPVMARAVMAYSKLGKRPNLKWDHSYTDHQTFDALLKMIQRDLGPKDIIDNQRQ